MVEDAMLDEWDEALLMKYVDGECGFFGRRRAASLLKRNVHAKRFVHELRFCCKKGCEGLMPKEEPELWGRISARIAQEERTAVLLGGRELRKEWSWSLASALSWSRLSWSGAAAGAAMAGLALFVVQSDFGGSGVDSNDTLSASISSSPMIEPVVAKVRESRPSITLRRSDPIEVDWVRSNGRVKVIHDRSSAGGILWVSRATSELIEAEADEPIRIIEKRVPRAYSVSGKSR